MPEVCLLGTFCFVFGMPEVCLLVCLNVFLTIF